MDKEMDDVTPTHAAVPDPRRAMPDTLPTPAAPVIRRRQRHDHKGRP